MPWQIIVHTDLPIIETSYSGIMTKTDLFGAAHETLDLGHAHNRTRFLADCSMLTGGHTIFDLYFLAREISIAANLEALKEAVLLPSYASWIEKINFWETIGINRGFQVRIFRDRKLAIAWLLQ